ncbi:DUF3298 domain-containing protein [Thiohalocapsa marina]|uniref:DUF3298 domain-containing protein n=1 Tax=Thiohalocapsa marina TaxID=424902 RepID=UPI0036D99D64
MRPSPSRPRVFGLSLAWAFAAFSASPFAASFDCDKARTPVERAICADPALDALDLQLASAYAQALRRAGATAGNGNDTSMVADRLRDDQRGWLFERDRCPDRECIEQAYRQRLAALRAAGDTALGPLVQARQDERIALSRSGPNIDIRATYPILSASAPGTAAANRVIESLVREQRAAFEAAYQGFLAENNGIHVGPPWSFDLSVTDEYESPAFWTLGLSTYRYTGGAHGGVELTSLVLDRSTGKRLPPEGLFRPGSPWLVSLSAYCRQALQQREPFEPGDDWLRRGTAPEPDNYAVLLPLAEGIKVLFGQYQIGPYAIGLFDVLVPYAALAEVLNPALFPTQAERM